ncbi:hypothetical protein [Pseudomonas sp. COR18]|uniref:hypothetical protein n=1 Tax=Pseudomonas sp. COR18 TaxID=3399680 RepID=UPI003AFF9797
MLHAYLRNKSALYHRYLPAKLRDPAEGRVTQEDEVTSIVFGPLEFPLKDENEILQDGSLFVFGDADRAARSWAFSIALMGVNTIDDVRRKVIKPMQALLLGAPASEALTGDIGGLIHYENVKDKAGGIHGFSV